MQHASTITVIRGTAQGSEEVAFAQVHGAENDRVTAARIIAQLLTAMDLEGVRPGFTLDYAQIAAEVVLEDWGYPVPVTRAVAA